MQRNAADYLVSCSVNHGCVLAASVKTEDTLACGIVEDGVRVVVTFRQLDPRRLLQSFQVEYRHGILATVAGVSLILILRQSDTVYARRVRDLRDHCSLVCVHNLHPRRTRDEQPFADRIVRQIVPAAVAANGELLFQLVLDWGRV